MRDALIFTALVIGAIGTLFPSAEDVVQLAPSDRPSLAAEAGAAAFVAKTPLPVGVTELTREDDGHFYAAVSANGAPLRMLVDTGASVIALTATDARSAGLSWNPAALTVVAEGASGPVRGVALTLERVALGGHEARNVPAVIVPEGLAVSLLGQSFLATIEPVRIEKDRMLLGGL